ncbi:hypothetical protein NSQ26_00780 [Bacillus sp. FSL W7-1360]
MLTVLPFSHTWPYEICGKDIYVSACPYCKQEQVLTQIGPRHLERMKEQKKVEWVMPCCHAVFTILEADDDYFWADEPLRG